MMRTFFRAFRVILVVFFGAILAVFTYFRKQKAVRFHPYLYKGFCHAFGIKDIRVVGEPLCTQSCLMASNHISYLDIAVLGSLMPCQFIGKEEVRHWPILGWISHHLGTIFISRKPRNSALHIKEIAQAFQQKKTLVLFPESTTGDGCRSLPFKSPFFQLDPHILIQPISLKYTHVNGMPATRFFQKRLSWRGTWTFIKHVKNTIFKIRYLSVSVMFHAPFLANQDRKKLADRCFQSVQQGLKAL